MILQVAVVGPYAENTYIVGSEETKEVMLIDPGAQAQDLLRALDKAGLKVTLLVSTHGHEDHVGAVAAIKEATGAPFGIHANDVPIMRKSSPESSIIPDFRVPPEPDFNFKEGDILEIGELSFLAIETHGHTPGGVSLLGPGIVFTGDTLFRGSVGRTDFEGGNWDQLIDSIKTRLLTLPDDTTVFPGHGPQTTIGAERQWNPFLRKI